MNDRDFYKERDRNGVYGDRDRNSVYRDREKRIAILLNLKRKAYLANQNVRDEALTQEQIDEIEYMYDQIPSWEDVNGEDK